MNIGVLGGSSPVGYQLIRLLSEQGASVVALSRSTGKQSSSTVQWLALNQQAEWPAQYENIELWISVAPIWVLSDHYPLLQRLGIKKIVALSSTSRFTKTTSSDAHEAKVVNDLIVGEESLQAWARQYGIQWVVLRPTLIYGRSTDRNLCEIVRIIRKFRFFPLLGPGKGLRQPIYVDDVAQACVQAALSDRAVNKDYNISGAEILTYRNMVSSVFIAMGLTPRLMQINTGFFKVAIAALRLLPRYRHWSFNMADRMSKDMVFPHDEAKADFGFSPRGFGLAARDVQ